MAVLFTLVACLSCYAPQFHGLTFRSEVVAKGGHLLLGQVTDLSNLPLSLRARAARLALFKLPPNRAPSNFEKCRLASRARALMPALAPWLSGEHRGETVVIQKRVRSGNVFASFAEGEKIEKGAHITVTVKIGGVMIERKATALQSARPSQPFFAKTSEGDVLRATNRSPE